MCGSAFTKIGNAVSKVDPVFKYSSKLAAKAEPYRDKLYSSLGLQSIELRNNAAEAGGYQVGGVYDTKESRAADKAAKAKAFANLQLQGTTAPNGLVIGKTY